MERETDPGIQANNGAPMGAGQPGKRPKVNPKKAIKKRATQGEDPQQIQQAIMGTQGAPIGGPVPEPPGGMPPQAQGPQVAVGPGLAELQTKFDNRGGTPGVPASLGGYSNVGNMLGFNTSLDYGGNESAANSMKNQFGQIASRYKAAPSMTQAILGDADFQRLFPNARIVDHHNQDQIDFGGQIDPHSGKAIHRVDVGGAFDSANDSAAGWTWQDLVNDVQGPAPGAAIYNQTQQQVGQAGGNGMQQVLQGMDENSLMELLRNLMAEDEQGGEGGGYV